MLPGSPTRANCSRRLSGLPFILVRAWWGKVANIGGRCVRWSVSQVGETWLRVLQCTLCHNFIVLLPQELNDVLPSISPRKSPWLLVPRNFLQIMYKFSYQRIVLFLVTSCRGLQCSRRRFHSLVYFHLHSRESPFIKPPAFFHRLIKTLQPPWPERCLLSLLTRSFLAKPREGLRQRSSPKGGIDKLFDILKNPDYDYEKMKCLNLSWGSSSITYEYIRSLCCLMFSR